MNYVVRNQSDEDRAAFIKPFQDALKIEEGQKALEEDINRRRKIFSMVLNEVKGLGEGSEKGTYLCKAHAATLADLRSEIEGFFNLLYSHLFVLYPADSPETTQCLTSLLQTISSSSSEQASITYRMYDRPLLYFYQFTHITLFLDCLTSSMQPHDNLLSACWCTAPSCKLQLLIMN